MLRGRKITDDFIDKLDLDRPSNLKIGTNYEYCKELKFPDIRDLKNVDSSFK